jgi:dehydrogenase/reductase SDR family member 7B
MPFKGKVIWITGASSGIGAGLALEFAKQGARCVLTARRLDRLESVRQACERPDDHMVYQLDATDYGTHEKAVEEIEDVFGPVDILVLNSGIAQRGKAVNTGLEVTRRIMDVNFTGTISLARLTARRMVSRRRGQIVVISSVLGRISIPGSSAYSASKFALHGYFEALRGEVHSKGVGVTLVCPGYINTDITLHALQADGSEFGVIDDNHTYGMDSDVCARKIARAVAKRRPVFAVGGKETLTIPLGRLFPGLLRVFGRRYTRK